VAGRLLGRVRHAVGARYPRFLRPWPTSTSLPPVVPPRSVGTQPRLTATSPPNGRAYLTRSLPRHSCRGKELPFRPLLLKFLLPQLSVAQIRDAVAGRLLGRVRHAVGARYPRCLRPWPTSTSRPPVVPPRNVGNQTRLTATSPPNGRAYLTRSLPRHSCRGKELLSGRSSLQFLLPQLANDSRSLRSPLR
jgi:hypothetical protein